MPDYDQVSHLDDHLAEWLVRPAPVGIGDLVRFDHSKQQWHVWDGFRWAPDKTRKVYDMVRDAALQYIVESSGQARKSFLHLLNTSKKESVLKALSAMSPIALTGTEWDPDPELLAFTNGVMNLRTKVFNPAPGPELMLSRSTGHPWDPDADMTAFATFVREVMGEDPGLTEYLMRVLGYAMIGWQREQKFWMWVGQGQNGKGTLAKVVTAALGDYADTPSAELYMKTRFGAARSDAPRPDLLRLHGVRFTWMSEPAGGHFNEELLKAHTGDDPIQARDLYGKAASFTTFRPTHTINFLTNDPPRTEDVGPSMSRRVRIVKFEQDFRGEREDKGLEERLKRPENLQGALRLLVEGAHEYFTSGLDEPAAVTRWSSEYIEENDPLASFIEEACTVGKNLIGSAPLLWAAYQDWCAQRDDDPGSRLGFGHAMGRRFQKRRKESGYIYLGIKPKSASELPDDE